MYKAIELVAKKLVLSGLLRIDGYSRVNFARLYRPYERINLTFTRRELNDKKLLPRTKKIITDSLAPFFPKEELENKVDSEIKRLNTELDKHQFTEFWLEMKIARLLVQSNHPVVIMLAILEKVEIYVSYSHSIGDVLDVITYQQAGNNGGMQSTDGRNAAIFVSCGGDPFGDQQDKEITYGDGFPAMARLMVIAGQEIGHYADIIRDLNGNHISRHSSNFNGTRAKQKMRKSRERDIQNTRRIEKSLNINGLTKLTAIENHVRIFKKFKRIDFEAIKYYLKRIILTRKIKIFMDQNKLYFYKSLPKLDYLGNEISLFIADQKFNIAPKADVYRNDDPKIEEAIACIEAIARVPQQVNKWGHDAVGTFWPNMYKLYYQDIIDGCILSYENYTGKPFKLMPGKIKKSWKYWFKNLFKKKNKPIIHY